IVGAMVWSGFVAPHAGLALATVLSAWLNALLLLRGLRAEGAFRAGPGWPLLLLRVLVACAAMSAVIAWLGGDPQDWVPMTGRERVVRLLGVIAAGAAVYAAALLAMGLRPRHLSGGAS
ncbi:MAG: lipid II flippase MurJ, partial [Pseudomonadota bacterium]